MPTHTCLDYYPSFISLGSVVLSHTQKFPFFCGQFRIQSIKNTLITVQSSSPPISPELSACCKTGPVGLPWWYRGAESARQRRGHRFNPWSGKIPHAAGQLSPSTATTEARAPTYIPSLLNFPPISLPIPPSRLIQSPCSSFLSHTAHSHWLSIRK